MPLGLRSLQKVKGHIWVQNRLSFGDCCCPETVSLPAACVMDGGGSAWFCSLLCTSTTVQCLFAAFSSRIPIQKPDYLKYIFIFLIYRIYK